MRQLDILEKAFLRGETLTPLDALRRYGVGRFGARIGELKKAGLSLEGKWRKVNNGQGHIVRVKEFFIPKEVTK